MEPAIRRVALVAFAALIIIGLALVYRQVLTAPSLLSSGENPRSILQEYATPELLE
jgi:hypothetical protein